MTDFDDDQLAAESAREKEILQQRDIEDIRYVMGSEQGRRVIWGGTGAGQGVFCLLCR